MRGGAGIRQDCGWGWLVVMAAFSAHVITHGILYSFGVLFVAIHDIFQGYRSETALVGSLANGTLYLIGPVAGYLVSRFGGRFVTVLGAIMGSLGYIISAFVPNVYVLYLTMGIVSGTGFGMVFLTAIVTVTQYFTKYRSLACGIAISGAGIGAFIFSPLIKMLLDRFALRGTLLILGGICLNCIPCGLILHLARRTKEKNGRSESGDTMEALVHAPDLKSYDHTREDVFNKEIYMTECDSKNDPEIENDINSESKLNSNRGKEETSLIHGISTDNNHVITTDDQFRQLQAVGKDETSDSDKKTSVTIKDHLLIFKNKIFLLFTTSQFLFFFGFYLPFIYIPDKAKVTGIDENGVVWVAPIIGISSIVSRIGLGYVADRPNVNRLLMFKIALLTTGVSTCVCPALNNLWSLCIYAVVYGMSTGLTLSLTSVVLVDLLGMDRLTDAFGMNNLLTGMATLLGPPFAGYLFDITRTYEASFLAAGIVMTVGGLMMFMTPFIINKPRSGKQIIFYVKQPGKD